MLFNSINFLFFFIVIYFLYFFINHKYRWILLLLTSYYFYMSWNPKYIILIIISTLIDYIAAIKMGKTQEKKKRKVYLILSLVSNLGLLFIFKYFNFVNDSFRIALENLNYKWGIPNFKLLLPVGISFYTFQTLSYTIDVYRGNQKPEKHLGIFALYVSFFPQLVAGPIERSTNLLPQFYIKQNFDYKRVSDGIKLIIWGYFKKVVVADRLCVLVDVVYNNPHYYSGLTLIVATVFFAFQIYCDFSGYSDIAIGISQILGIKLMDNFKRPYFSKSIKEFWKRWHISLSTWFQDYVYIPLGGNKVSKIKYYRNLFLTFLISGLWHGANWTFIVWGALHGFYLISGLYLKKIREKMVYILYLNKVPLLLKYINIITTFILVNIAWVFFRANKLADALYIFKNMFKNLYIHLTSINGLKKALSGLRIEESEFYIAIFVIFFMELVHYIQKHGSIRHMLEKKPFWIRWMLYYFMLNLIFILGVFGSNQFIYFQF